MERQASRSNRPQQPAHESASVDTRVHRWRRLLRVAAVANIALWLVMAVAVWVNAKHQSVQLWLSALFLIGCAFRSFFPAVYVNRFAFENHWTSSTFVGRCIATVAEVAFAFQLYLLLQHWSVAFGVPYAGQVAWMVVALLCIAQASCWYGVATRRYMGELVEESLWTVGIGIFFTAVLAIALAQPTPSFAVVTGVFASGGFLVFMLTHNLPMFFRRIRDRDIEPLPFRDGLLDMFHRRNVSYRWQHWAGEAAWLTPYFTVVVWLSIATVLITAV